AVGVKGGETGATVVEEELFEVVEGALEDHCIHMFAIKIGMGAGLALVARFHDDVDLVAEGIEQFHENLEEPFGGNRRRQNGHLIPGFGITIDVATIAFAGDYFQAERGPNRIGEREVSISSDSQVSIELIRAEVVKAGSRHTARVGAQHPLEKALDKTHRK